MRPLTCTHTVFVDKRMLQAADLSAAICRKTLPVIHRMRSAMSYSTWRNYVVNQPQCNFKVTRSPLIATFNYPGLNHNCDRNDLIDIFGVLSHIVDTQYLPIFYPYKNGEEKWFQWGELFKERYIFASSVELTASRSLHNRQLLKWPLQARCVLRSIGNSTIAHQIESYLPGSTEPLVTYLVQMVTVDKVTRKSKPLPDWFIKKYKDQCSMKTGFQLKPFPRPKTTFVYSRQVMWLDTDKNNHSDFASYIRFALDGLHCAIKQETQQAAKASSKSDPHTSTTGVLTTSSDTSHSGHPSSSVDGANVSDSVVNRSGELQSSPVSVIQIKSSGVGSLKGMTKDVIKRGFKSVKVCYVNECLEGAVVDVHIWQEENEPNIARCSIEKGSQIICQLILEYHDQVAKL